MNVISITNFFIHVSGNYFFLKDENHDNHNSSEVNNNNVIFSMAVGKGFDTCLSELYHTIILMSEAPLISDLILQNKYKYIFFRNERSI